MKYDSVELELAMLEYLQVRTHEKSMTSLINSQDLGELEDGAKYDRDALQKKADLILSRLRKYLIVGIPG